jgi:ribosomal protein S18 acetylase RimI-like enzyme
VDIRRLVPADAAKYRAFRLRGLAEHPDAFTSSHDEDAKIPLEATNRRLAPGGPDAVWGAFVDGELAGVLGLTVERRAKNRHKAHVFGMYVPAEFGRRGIGRALVAHVIATARATPYVEQLTLTVTRGNGRARGLYAAAGFATFGVEPRAIRVGDSYFDKEHMVLFLEPGNSAAG